MKHHVKRMIDKGITAAEDSGYPKIEHSDKVPESEVYTLYQMRNSNPRATSTHSKLPFLRQHCVNVAVERMKNRCIYPVNIKELKWNNFLQYFYEFHVHYCELEGLTRSHELSRQVLLYLCYGSYKDKGKLFPIIRCLHYKTIQGRHRFGKYVLQHFHEFIKEVDKHPEWKIFFDDLGKGNAPTKYLVSIETGLRSFGNDIHAMGSRAMDSQERWFAVPVWRKREAYIALIRHIRNHLTYPQWDCYKLEDYAERQALHKTFLARHFPLTNGKSDRLEKYLVNPPKWSEPDHVEVKPPPSKRVKKHVEVKPDVIVSSPSAAKPMIWDVENNCFVPF